MVGFFLFFFLFFFGGVECGVGAYGGRFVLWRGMGGGRRGSIFSEDWTCRTGEKMLLCECVVNIVFLIFFACAHCQNLLAELTRSGFVLVDMKKKNSETELTASVLKKDPKHTRD